MNDSVFSDRRLLRRAARAIARRFRTRLKCSPPIPHFRHRTQKARQLPADLAALISN